MGDIRERRHGRMKKIITLDELSIPDKHREFLERFLENVTAISNLRKIEKLVIFGSCARGEATDQSDIDIVALGEDIDDETLWELYDCTPEYAPGKYVKNDIFAINNSQYNEHINSFGQVQKYIAREGIDISGLLRERSALV